MGSFISPWSSLSFCLVKFDTLLLGTYITQWELLCLLGELTPLSLCNAPIYSWYFPVLKCTLSIDQYRLPSLHFTENQYSYFHFCLHVIPIFSHFRLICVLIFTYRQHIVMSYFLIQSDKPLLIGTFRLLIFKMIIDIVLLIPTIFVSVFYVLPLIFVPTLIFHFVLLLVVLIEHFDSVFSPLLLYQM